MYITQTHEVLNSWTRRRTTKNDLLECVRHAILLIGKYCNIGNLIPCVFSYSLTFVIGRPTQVSFAYVLVLFFM